MDVIAINRYYSWYADPGHTETIPTQLATDLELWYETHGKPMMLTEYGAGTVAGLHRVCRGVKRRSIKNFMHDCYMCSAFICYGMPNVFFLQVSQRALSFP